MNKVDSSIRVPRCSEFKVTVEQFQRHIPEAGFDENVHDLIRLQGQQIPLSFHKELPFWVYIRFFLGLSSNSTG